jgi:hypothetical protein
LVSSGLDPAPLGELLDPATGPDGALLFPLRSAILATVLLRSAPLSTLAAALRAYEEDLFPADALMLPLLGSPLFPRAIHFGETPPRFDSVYDIGADTAWSGQPALPVEREPFERLALAFAVLLTTRGAPVLFYGDEIGLPGGGDPDNQRLLPWAGLTAPQEWLRDRVSRLARIRREHPALRRGTRTFLGGTDDLLATRLDHGDDQVIVVVNRADTPADATGVPAGRYYEQIDRTLIELPTPIPARTAWILEPR